MISTWKLSILGGAVALGSVAIAVGGCTVTTTSGTGDDGGVASGDGAVGSDAGADTASASDTGTGSDGGAGGDAGTTCSATATCAIIGSSQGVTFDNCATCDTCMATTCCAETTACFGKTADGGQSECEQLFDCVAECSATDGGDSCVAACAQAHPEGVQPGQALRACQQNGCSAADGGTPACQ